MMGRRVALLVTLLLFAIGGCRGLAPATPAHPGSTTGPVVHLSPASPPALRLAAPPTIRTVAQWWYDGGQLRTQQLQAALAQLADTTDVQRACAHLAVEVATAMGYPAVPDGQLQPFWSAALAGLARDARLCHPGPVAALDEFVRRMRGRLS